MSPLRQQLTQQLADYGDEVIAIIGPDYMDEAIIGLAHDGFQHRLVYATHKIVSLLKTHEGLSDEEALERFSRTIESIDYGPGTPMYLSALNLDFSPERTIKPAFDSAQEHDVMRVRRPAMA